MLLIMLYLLSVLSFVITPPPSVFMYVVTEGSQALIDEKKKSDDSSNFEQPRSKNIWAIFFAWTIIHFASKNGWPYITKKCINWKRAIQKSISSCYVSKHGQWITDSDSKMKFTWPAIYSLTVLTSGQILSLEWGFQFHELYCSQ